MNLAGRDLILVMILIALDIIIVGSPIVYNRITMTLRGNESVKCTRVNLANHIVIMIVVFLLWHDCIEISDLLLTLIVIEILLMIFWHCQTQTLKTFV